MCILIPQLDQQRKDHYVKLFKKTKEQLQTQNLLIITRMKKLMIKGMALLSLGIAFTACSRDVYDENYADKVRVNDYDQAFTKEFGTIAKGHKWGFDQTTGRSLTRAAVTSTNEYWIIPENCWGPSQNKEGWNATEIRQMFINRDKEGGILSTLSDFSFDNYFLQHVKKAQGKGGGAVKHSVAVLEAFNSTTNPGKWEPVTNFEGADNPDGVFTVTAENTYFYAPTYKSVKGTTLMADMGGNADPNGKLFRLKNTDGTYNYDYGFIRTNAYHKDIKKTINNEPFLVFELPAKKDGDTPLYWVIRLGVGEKATEPNPILAEGRVLCEDMGANDFDFNDVVFDATIMRTGEINIKVLAHGGKLPIAIDGVDVTLGQMTNTGVNVADYQEITIAAVGGQPKYSTIEAIPVTVNPNGKADDSYNLEAKVGSAPQKICAPVGTLWPLEYKKISQAYSPFTTWVNTKDPAEWSAKMDPEYVFEIE